MKISIVVPIYNERENIDPLILRIGVSMRDLDYEAILVDDGSHDGSDRVIREAVEKEERVKAIFLQKNFGQTAAIAAGVDHSTGGVIVPMDGDLENDPADIVKLVEKLDHGFDVVSGWRHSRWHGQFLTRKLPSTMANWLISKISGLRLHDYGCTLKAYRANVIKSINLYGDMHRFLPAYAHWNGAKVGELKVGYQKRRYGQSKYGLARTWRVLMDLITLKFLSGYATRPIHLFGSFGFGSIVLGIVAGVLAVYFKLSEVNHKDFIETPLPVITAVLIMLGIMLILLGLLAEIMVRTYHESQGKKVYTVKEKINFH